MSNLYLKKPASWSLQGLSIARMSLGIATLVAPQFTANLFAVPLGPATAVIGRLFGVRELALGAVALVAHNYAKTISASNVTAVRESRRDIGRILWVGLLVDFVDFGSCVVGIWNGEVDGEAARGLGGGAIFAGTLGVIGLRNY